MSRDESTIDDLLDAIDMEFYCDREGIDYRHTHGTSGAQLNLQTCPVCGGNSWKVYIGADTGLGNCFHGSCEARFNKWSFIKAHLGATSTAAVRAHLIEVAREMGWRPAKKAVKEVEAPAEWELPTSFPLPTDDGRNLEYLEKRGITTELTRYFHLRYCYRGWFNYQDEEGNRRGQKFDDRVLIPVFDLEGKLVTFQGRDLTGEAERKYLFPMKLPATGRFLYNGHNAVGAKAACVGEGAFDVIAIKCAFDQVPALRDVAPLGTFGKHLSGGLDANARTGADQLGAFIQLKERGLEEVTIMWDGEVKALEDAVKAGELLKKIGLKAFVALLPAGCDPNEVAPLVVCRVYMNRVELTAANIVKLRLKNPYRQSRR